MAQSHFQHAGAFGALSKENAEGVCAHERESGRIAPGVGDGAFRDRRGARLDEQDFLAGFHAGFDLGKIEVRDADFDLAFLGGLTTHRTLPRFASRAQLRRSLLPSVRSGDVVMVVDSFTKGFRPEVAGAAQRVLNSAGNTVECNSEVCCGLTMISTGQLGRARKSLAKAAEILDDGTDRPIVVVEPSCAAAFKKDLPELIHTDAARRVSARIRSFASMVTELTVAGWQPQWNETGPPDEVTVQTHCHEYSVFGAATQAAALKALGVRKVREATGCCGVAGNFGFEPDHYDISVKVAEQGLMPALNATAADIPVLADGFSCQMQLMHLAKDRVGLHLAELLDPQLLSSTDTSEGQS